MLHADVTSAWQRGLVPTLALLALLAGGTGCGVREPVPVVVTLRDSLVGEGQVAVFSNQTPNRLTISIALQGRTADDRLSGNLDLDPNGTAEVGWMEGWRFRSGETITISHPSYRTKTLHVP